MNNLSFQCQGPTCYAYIPIGMADDPYCDICAAASAFNSPLDAPEYKYTRPCLYCDNPIKTNAKNRRYHRMCAKHRRRIKNRKACKKYYAAKKKATAVKRYLKAQMELEKTEIQSKEQLFDILKILVKKLDK